MTKNEKHNAGMEVLAAKWTVQDEYADLLDAAKQVLWKLSHNHADAMVGNVQGYTGPALVSRQDATVRRLADVIAALEGEAR